MTATTRIGILGAGAAGTAAARTLIDSGADITAELIAAQAPFNRTLVNKGVAIGLLTPDQAQLPSPGAKTVSDTVEEVDVQAGAVRLASAGRRDYDALIIATGSTPLLLDPNLVPGAAEAAAANRLTTLHSLSDACRVRDLIASTLHPMRIIILGAGLIAAETASLLRDAGHDVVLVARSPLPGASAFGEQIAEVVAELHRTHATTHFGRDLQAMRADRDQISVRLDDDSQLYGDLVIVAHGTLPAAPAPWSPGGVPVNNRLRYTGTTAVPIYAAGGVARIHDDLLGDYRIDHWDDATAQGAHAARAVLHDLGNGADPERYLPRSMYACRIYGHTITGLGMTGHIGHDRRESNDPLVIVREHDGIPIAAHGFNATTAIHQWKNMLFR